MSTIRFALLTGTLLAALAVALTFIYRQQARNGIFESAEAHNVTLTAVLNRALRPTYIQLLDDADDSEALKKFDTLTKAMLTGLPIVKVKLYDLTGTTLYSTDPAQIGQQQKDNKGVMAAKDGTVTSGHSFRQTFGSMDGTINDRDILETYIPAHRPDGQIEAVFELYHDLTPIMRNADQTVLVIMLVTGGGFTLIFAILYFAMGVLERQAKARQAEAIELAETNAGLSEAARLRGEFLANMSHELRSPLNAVIGFAEAIQSEIFGPLRPKQYREYADHIVVSGHFLLRIVNEVLDMSKIEHGEVVLDEEVFVLSNVVADAKRIAEAAFKEDVPRIVLEKENNRIKIRADRRRIQQVLVNLMSNAIKFTDPSGEVTVGLSLSEGRGVKITVQDTGQGMSSYDLKRVLVPFVQAANAYTRSHAGTGLGLPIANAIVELHGGTLDIESALGKGTTVTVVLPPDRTIGPTVAEAA